MAEFNPLKHRQPIVGDARCAMYAMANLFDDRAFLLMNNVNEMTHHEQEIGFVRHWAEANTEQRWAIVNHIEFHAGIFGNGRIHLEDLNLKGTGSAEVYYAGLMDYRIPGRDYAHTVGFLWPEGEEVIILDPQKNNPHKVPKANNFKLLEIVGFRLFSNTSEQGHCFGLCQFTTEAFPHIFNLQSNIPSHAS